MKTTEQILRECPKHDCAYVLYNSRWHRIEEHQLRRIELAVIRGEIEPPQIKLNGVIAKFGENGSIEKSPHLYNGCNIYELNSRISLERFKFEIARRNNSQPGRL